MGDPRARLESRTHTLALVLRLALLATVLATSPCLAWGGDGHRIVGTIASSDLTPATAAAVRDLLGEQTLADACCWADEIRSDKQYDWIKPLHYINVPMGATSIDVQRDAAGGQQVLAAIDRFKAVLADAKRPRQERLQALRLVLHLVADVHQPLHVSYAVDLGGNKLAVTSFGERSNMHRVWDSDLIRRRLKETKGGWATLSADLRQAITPERRETWRKARDSKAWAEESLAITRRLYAEPPDAKEGVNDAYWKAWMPTVEQRLQAAGVRLAVVLNEALDANAPPAQNAPRPADSTVNPVRDLPPGR